MRNAPPFRFVLFLLLISPCFAYQPNQDIILTNGLDAVIEQSRESFEATYYQMVEKGLFPVSYNNNLIINSTLQSDVQKEGVVLLKLIEWLEKQDDQSSYLLLEKLNYLYFLEMHSLLSRMNLKKDPGSSILALCQDLYYCTVLVRYADGEHDTIKKTPFRSALSKLFLMISIINHSHVHYEERKETLAFALEGIKQEMLAINQALGVNKTDQDYIKTFVTLLQVYACKEPIMESHNVRKIVIATAVTAFVGLLVYKFVLPHKEKILEQLKVWATDLRDAVLDPLGEGVGKGAAKGIIAEFDKPENKEKLRRMAEEASRSMIDGMAMGADGEPNENTALVGEQISRGAVHGMATNPAGQPNPEMEIVGTQMSRGVVHGLATDPAGQPNPEMEIVGTQMSRGVVHGLATDPAGQPNPEIAIVSERISRNAMHGLATDPQGEPNPDPAMLSSQLMHGALAEQPHQRNNPIGSINPNIEAARNHMAAGAGMLGRQVFGDPIPPANNQGADDDNNNGWFRLG